MKLPIVWDFRDIWRPGFGPLFGRALPLTKKKIDRLWMNFKNLFGYSSNIKCKMSCKREVSQSEDFISSFKELRNEDVNLRHEILFRKCTVAHHMTKSNIRISRELFDKWMIVCGEQRPTSDVSWKLTNHCTSDGCTIISCSTTTKFIYKDKGVSCRVSEDGRCLAQFDKESAFTWNTKEWINY